MQFWIVKLKHSCKWFNCCGAYNIVKGSEKGSNFQVNCIVNYAIGIDSVVVAPFYVKFFSLLSRLP